MTNLNTACPACDSTSSRTYMCGVSDLYHGMSGEWNLEKCTKCDLIYTTPFIPENRMGEYYPDDYSPFVEGSEASGYSLTQFLKTLAILPYTLRFGQPGYFPTPFGKGCFLDVGCGAGRYLKKMSSLGWQCVGLDVSTKAIDAAKKLNPSAKFVVGAISDLELGERFDLIVMHHVLEHLYQPKQVVEACFRLLQSGGLLVVNTPNIGSWEARWFGPKWKGLDMPRHTLHFKESVLERLLVEAGFTIEKKRPGMFASSISESFIMSLPAKLRRKIIHSRFERIIYLMLVPLAAISYILGNRGTLEIVAVKK